MADVKARIRDFILQECLPGEAPEKLRDDTPLRGVLDSMTSLKLVTLIERDAGIEIEARDLGESFSDVKSIMALVEKRQAQGR